VLLGEEAAATKTGRISIALWRELMIGHEICLGINGSKSRG